MVFLYDEYKCKIMNLWCSYNSRFALSQWEMALLCNSISHWLGPSLGSALHWYITNKNLRMVFKQNSFPIRATFLPAFPAPAPCGTCLNGMSQGQSQGHKTPRWRSKGPLPNTLHETSWLISQTQQPADFKYHNTYTMCRILTLSSFYCFSAHIHTLWRDCHCVLTFPDGIVNSLCLWKSGIMALEIHSNSWNNCL